MKFEHDASRSVFLRDFGGSLRQMSPKLPFEFTYAAQLYLGEYDTALGGFPLNGAPNLNAVPFDWLQPSADFQWPEMFVPASQAAAKRLLEQLQAANTGNHIGPRSLRLAAVIEASGADPGSMQLQLKLRQLTSMRTTSGGAFTSSR